MIQIGVLNNDLRFVVLLKTTRMGPYFIDPACIPLRVVTCHQLDMLEIYQYTPPIFRQSINFPIPKTVGRNLLAIWELWVGCDSFQLQFCPFKLCFVLLMQYMILQYRLTIHNRVQITCQIH